jgi:hypothetical protein
MDNEEYNNDWVWDIAEATGFDVSDTGEITVPYGSNLSEMLESYATIIAELAVRNYVTLMTKDLIGNNTVH